MLKQIPYNIINPLKHKESLNEIPIIITDSGVANDAPWKAYILSRGTQTVVFMLVEGIGLTCLINGFAVTPTLGAMLAGMLLYGVALGKKNTSN